MSEFKLSSAYKPLGDQAKGNKIHFRWDKKWSETSNTARCNWFG